MATTRLFTLRDLEQMDTEEAERYEVFRGMLCEVEVMGGRHVEIEVEINVPLSIWVRAHGLGRIYTESTHFVILRDPDVVLMPDVAFVQADRLPPEEERFGVMRLAPDLAVEVFSPSNRLMEMAEKVALYHRGGVRLVWVVDPRRRAVTVHVSEREPSTLSEAETLDGGDVLPGFRLAVGDIFR